MQLHFEWTDILVPLKTSIPYRSTDFLQPGQKCACKRERPGINESPFYWPTGFRFCPILLNHLFGLNNVQLLSCAIFFWIQKFIPFFVESCCQNTFGVTGRFSDNNSFGCRLMNYPIGNFESRHSRRYPQLFYPSFI